MPDKPVSKQEDEQYSQMRSEGKSKQEAAEEAAPPEMSEARAEENDDS